MTELEGFLRAAKDDALDDGPRLILADWLDEIEQPARAEFVRVQCELLRVVHNPHAWVRRERLRQREAELLAEYRQVWLEPLRPLFRYADFVDPTTATRSWSEGVWFERGLVHARLLLERLFHYAASVHRRDDAFVWVERLAVMRTSGGEISRLADWPYLYHISQLSLYDLRESTRSVEAEIAHLLGSSQLAQLRWLSLDLNLGPAVVELLAAAPSLSGLVVLELNSNPIGDSGVQVLARSPYLRHLRHLSLRGCDIRDPGLYAILESPYLQQLQRLDLHANHIRDAGVRALLESPLAQSLHYVDLGNNRISTYWRREFNRTFGQRGRSI